MAPNGKATGNRDKKQLDDNRQELLVIVAVAAVVLERRRTQVVVRYANSTMRLDSLFLLFYWSFENVLALPQVIRIGKPKISLGY